MVEQVEQAFDEGMEMQKEIDMDEQVKQAFEEGMNMQKEIDERSYRGQSQAQVQFQGRAGDNKPVPAPAPTQHMKPVPYHADPYHTPTAYGYDNYYPTGKGGKKGGKGNAHYSPVASDYYYSPYAPVHAPQTYGYNPQPDHGYAPAPAHGYAPAPAYGYGYDHTFGGKSGKKGGGGKRNRRALQRKGESK